MKSSPTFLSIASGIMLLAACDGTSQCVKLSAYAADEARACLESPETATELRACSPDPQTRGVRIVCLVDDAGKLYVTVTSDSARVSGTGWRYTGGVGDQQLSVAEEMRCSDFSSSVGYPEPAKQCPP
jgi:hypothetical protein